MNEDLHGFWHATWFAWHSGPLPSLSSDPLSLLFTGEIAQEAAGGVDHFIMIRSSAKYRAIETFFETHSPRHGEFLLNTLEWKNRASTVLTSQRLWMLNTDTGKHVVFELNEIDQIKSGMTINLTLCKVTIRFKDKRKVIYNKMEMGFIYKLVEFALKECSDPDGSSFSSAPSKSDSQDSSRSQDVLTQPRDDTPIQRFWRTTWSAWATGALSSISENYSQQAAGGADDFIKARQGVKFRVITAFLATHAPRHDEFLIGYGQWRTIAAMVLTSQRLWMLDMDTRRHVAFELKEIGRMKSVGLNSNRVTIWFKDNREQVYRVESAPNNKSVTFALNECCSPGGLLFSSTRNESENHDVRQSQDVEAKPHGDSLLGDGQSRDDPALPVVSRSVGEDLAQQPLYDDEERRWWLAEHDGTKCDKCDTVFFSMMERCTECQGEVEPAIWYTRTCFERWAFIPILMGILYLLSFLSDTTGARVLPIMVPAFYIIGNQFMGIKFSEAFAQGQVPPYAYRAFSFMRLFREGLVFVFIFLGFGIASAAVVLWHRLQGK